jgi:hypothetical protein
MNNIVEKSFYLTSLFADIKSDHNWTSNEIKTVMILLSKISRYKIAGENFEKIKTPNELRENIKTIPLKYIITKQEFIDITKVRVDNTSREINRVRKKLISKIIHTFHPIEDDPQSGMSISWFHI